MTLDRLRAAFLDAALPATLGISSIFHAAAFNNDMLGQAGLIKNGPTPNETVEERENRTLGTLTYIQNMTGPGGRT